MASDHNPISRRTMMTHLGAGITGAAITSAVPVAGQTSGNETAAPFADPTAKYPKPPYPGQSQPWPGLASKMNPRPDHGETSYKGSGRLKGRKALITGGDSGMGRAAAIAYAREGADVAISYYPIEEPDAREVIELIKAEGRKAIPIPGDLRQESYCKELVAKAVESLGGLDVVVSNAGRQQQCEDILELTTEAFDATIKTNIYAPFWIIKAAVPHLKPGSCIIGTTSEQAYDPAGNLYDYAQTKAATMNYVKSLAKQLGPKGIRVNGVAPGPIWTPCRSQEERHRNISYILARRIRYAVRDSRQNSPASMCNLPPTMPAIPRATSMVQAEVGANHKRALFDQNTPIGGRLMPKNPDPREVGPKPPFPAQPQYHPGTVHQLKPKADHGEESYTASGKLTGQSAIVTGADSGIGRAVAIAFAKEGADIVLSYLEEEETDAREVVKLIEGCGRKAISRPGDIGSSEYARSLVDTAIQELGGLDIVVNNAGFQMTHPSIEEIPDEEFEHTFRTNVFGTFFLTKAALPKMKPGASIINTTSIQTFHPGEELIAYAATKAAIANMTKSIAKLAAEKGVRVNAVAPGPVWTPLIPSTMPQEKVRTFGENSVFKRPAQPTELSKLFVFLASADASYVSGEIFAATGGRTPL